MPILVAAIVRSNCPIGLVLLGGSRFQATLVLIGWLERENRPAIFTIELSTGGGKEEWVRKHSRHVTDDAIATELTELPILAMPPPSLDELSRASWRLEIDFDAMDHARDLLHLLEIQRRKKMDTGLSYVGGRAIWTTVTRNGVTQRVVHRWPEDKVGEPIRPKPIDWTAWRAAREKPAGSWLKRRKARKREG